MKQRVWWTIALVVSVILESSIFSVPLSLWLVGQSANGVGTKWAIWSGVLVGIVLDVLAVRTVGVSSAVIVTYLLGAVLLRRFLSQLAGAELIWFGAVACFWSFEVNGTIWAGLVMSLFAIIFHLWNGSVRTDLSLNTSRL